MKNQKSRDQELVARFHSQSETAEDYWSFKGNSRREYSHGLFQYPAMMVPQLAGTILQLIGELHPEFNRICDPFAGSGTVLTESMLRGLDFTAVDINPLAVLLCRVKAGPFFISSLRRRTNKLSMRIEGDHSTGIDISFANRDKWYTKKAQIALSRIRRGIVAEQRIWARRLFWVALAEVARKSSNTRSSTFKLHTRPAGEIKSLEHDVISLFRHVAGRNLRRLGDQAELLRARGLLVRGHYRKNIEIHLDDVRSGPILPRFDVVFSSPPYGDNKTTVPYGQYSYLPLQWIAMEDIAANATDGYLETTHEIDSRSLGGSKRIGDAEIQSLAERSPAFLESAQSLRQEPPDRLKRVAAFIRDVDESLDPILMGLRNGGLMVWVVGNRKVGGTRVPFDTILSELLIGRNVVELCKLARNITSKRMAARNDRTDVKTPFLVPVESRQIHGWLRLN